MKCFIITLLVACCYTANAQGTGPLPADKPFVLGTISEVYSNQLAEKRTLNIYLPAGYQQNDTTHYPVIYLLDGSADEDFIHITGLLQFANFPWVNQFPAAIIVGIANVNRRRDLTFPTTDTSLSNKYPEAGASAKFIAFIEKELQPFIEAKYKTNARKILIGQSLGGLLATQIVAEKPTMFTDYIVISPSLWWDNESLLDKIKTTPSSSTLKVFIAVGQEGKQMKHDSRKLALLLKQQNLVVSFHFFKYEDHASIMHLAVYEALKALR